jgi:hypothetical protein
MFGKILLLFSLAIPTIGWGQTPKKEDIWQPFEFLIGDWRGQGHGEPGTANYERQVRFIFNKKFIEIKNKSAWAPTPQNPQGEVHEDLGYISYDKVRKTYVLRQFHSEGFVNQYTLVSISAEGKIVFVSEAIENIPSGWRARETYQKIGDDEFSETFDLAPPDKGFALYSTVILKRTK